MNKPSRTYYNDDEALVESLRRGRDPQERVVAFQIFQEYLESILQELLPEASVRTKGFQQAWGMWIEWVKNSRPQQPLAKPAATYLLAFFQASQVIPSSTSNPVYRYRFIPKRILVRLAPASTDCQTGIVLRFEDSCYRILAQRFNTETEHPREVYSEAIMDLLKNLPQDQQQEKATLFTYFMVIARRKYSRFLQKQKRQFNIPEEEEEWNKLLRQNDAGYEDEPGDFSDVLRECQQEVIKHFHFENEGELVARLLPLANENYRDALRARFIEEQSYEEIGQQMGISVDNVRTNVHRGLKQLRKLLKRMS